MPINATIYYYKAEEEYHEAQTKEQKLKALKKMLATAPKHKGAEKLLKQIKTKISKLKYTVEKEAKQKSGGHSLSIKKEGAAQIVFVGLPNSGKSYVLEKLSGALVTQKDYPFSTKEPEIRMIDVGGAKLQGVEVPALYPGFYESDHGPELFSIIRNSDFVVLVIDGGENINNQTASLHGEFKKAEIELVREPRERSDFLEYKSGIVFINKAPYFGGRLLNLDVVNFKDSRVEDLRQALWAHLPLIRVHTRSGGEVASKPVVMKKGSTVKDLAEKVHKDFVKNFKYAKIWGSGSFPGQQVGLDYMLKDKDVVEVYTN